MGKIVTLKFPKFQDKKLIRAITASLFWSKPKSQLHKVMLMCGKHTRDVFQVFFFLCWIVILWHFLQIFTVCYSFSSIFKHQMLLRMPIQTFKLWNWILGGLHKIQCRFCCDWNFFLKFCKCHTKLLFLTPAKFGKA